MPNRAMRKRKKRGNPIGAAARLAVGAAGAWIAYSNYGIPHALPLPDAIRAERREFQSQAAGRVSYYADRAGTGRPLVLLHSINAAASAYEMKPLFERYRRTRPVYALDWAGYGFSERAAREYSPQLFQAALVEFLEKELGQAADVVALSLGGEFAARAAQARPALFHALGLISPSGLSRPKEGSRSMEAQASGQSDRLYSALAFPLWGRALFDLIATRASIAYFLRKSFVGAPPPEMIEYAYATSHQPGAPNVPLYFLSGKLFTPRIADTVYDRLNTPTLVLYDRDPYTGFDALPGVLAQNRQWQAVRVAPSLGLPHWERLEDVAASLDKFWSGS